MNDSDWEYVIPRAIALTCCCCGKSTKGRQWWNRDSGFGICPSCVDWQRKRGMDDDEERFLFGKEGFHYNINSEEV